MRYPEPRYAGDLDSDTHRTGVIVTMRNSDVVPIAHGRAVCRPAVPEIDKDAILPTSAIDRVFGLVVRTPALLWRESSDGTVWGSLKSTGLIPGALLSILRCGSMLVPAIDGCRVGDRLYVYTDGTLTSEPGVDRIDATANGVWLSSASAGSLAMLAFNALRIS